MGNVVKKIYLIGVSGDEKKYGRNNIFFNHENFL